MITKPGIYDLSFEEYLSDPAPEPSASSGILNTLATRSPAHAFIEHPRLNPSGEDDATSRSDLGSAAHGYLTGGAERIVYVEADDWRTKAAKEQRDQARAVGKIPVLAYQREHLEAMRTAAVETLLKIGVDLANCQLEKSLFWLEDGTWCRARPDIIPPRELIIDYKTTEDAEPGGWIRKTLLPGGYHVQGAHYLSGAHELGMPGRDFLFLVGEMTPPYACSLVGMGPTLRDVADRERRLGLDRWRRCLASGEWPAYPATVAWAEAPAWKAIDLDLKGAA